MRIAYPMRVDALDKPGGDLLQVMRYIEEGKKAGRDGNTQFEGVIITDMHSDLSSFDLIHLTNIDRPIDTYHAFVAARAARKPIFLSSIHHSYAEIERYERAGRGGLIGRMSGLLGFTGLEYLRSIVRSLHYPQLILPVFSMMGKGMNRCQREVLLGADQILALSKKERADLESDFGEIDENKCAYLANGLDCANNAAEGAGRRDIDVCMVGRIEARKNQIAVLEVLERLGLSGVFVGAENPNHPSYCKQFREMIENSGNTYLGSLSHEATFQIMKRARVHVSASWFEVLSLVDLEAYCAGCGVVASNAGGTREILGDKASYVLPDSLESIQNGIMAMLEMTSNGEFSYQRKRAEEPIAETWSQIGERLADLYRQYVC